MGKKAIKYCIFKKMKRKRKKKAHKETQESFLNFQLQHVVCSIRNAFVSEERQEKTKEKFTRWEKTNNEQSNKEKSSR